MRAVGVHGGDGGIRGGPVAVKRAAHILVVVSDFVRVSRGSSACLMFRIPYVLSLYWPVDCDNCVSAASSLPVQPHTWAR